MEDQHTDIYKLQELYPSHDHIINEEYREPSGNQIPGFKETYNYKPKYAANQDKKKKKNLIARFFSNMSRLGMDYEDDVIKNMKAIPADTSLVPKDVQLSNQDLFQLAGTNWKVKTNRDKNFFEKDFQQKRDALRNLAVQPELEDILDTMTNEAIVYDSDFTYFAEPFIEPQELQDFKRKVRKQIVETMNKHFRRFYKMLNWKYNAWDDFKRFLVEGSLAWEIVYDNINKPKEIIGIIPIDVATLTRSFENNKWYYIQFKGQQGKERKLLDSQIIYIAYQETNCLSRVSYLERLIRPFNIYRIVEQAQLIWTITNSSYKMKFTIPTKGMSTMMGKQSVAIAMNNYKEDIKFTSETGELTINGNVNMPFNKEYWFPESDAGSPEIEVLGGDGPELNDNDQLKFFKNQLYKISKIPLSRFDQESGETWFGTDATSVARVEIDFSRFVSRLRNIFSQIMIKPLQLQLALSIPELQSNRQFLESVSLQYKSYNLFEEMMDMTLMRERVDFIQTMKDSMVDSDSVGNDIKFFSSKFLVKKYLKLSDADLELNEKLKREEIEDLNLAGDSDNTVAPQESLYDLPANILEAKIQKKAEKARKRKEKQENLKKGASKDLDSEPLDNEGEEE